MRANSQYADLGTTNFGGNQITISIWANLHSNNNWQRFIDFGQGEADNNIVIAKCSPQLEVLYNILTGATNFHDEILQHILHMVVGIMFVLFLIITQQLAHYIDGVLDTSITTTQAIPTVLRDKSYIGRSNWSADSYTDGQIKSLNIWERALSAAEVDKLYGYGRNYNIYTGNYKTYFGTQPLWRIISRPRAFVLL